ncbi:MAG: segregation/condensation protein A [Chitinophagales bacterium]|nr:segregation/condensation protein A [Bacteroidota bacterium]MCB9043481.1 segregation/condensation protein A [Chitinophagales bacterium]
MTYTIKLQQFEGPFDLLLYFIQRDELNIYDIPIAKLTNDFLQYMHEMKRLNIELASEFILVAATLMRIKAKMLLPRKEINEQGEEIDPREELVTRLIEYKKYKAVTESLREMETARAQRFLRGGAKLDIEHVYAELGNEMELESINLFKMLRTFHKVINRMEARQNQPQHTVLTPPFNIQTEREFLLELLMQKQEITCQEVFVTCINKIHALYRFMAMLEIVQEKIADIRIGIGYNNFWLLLSSQEQEFPESPPAHQAGEQ